jgi:hypothetical protein
MNITLENSTRGADALSSSVGFHTDPTNPHPKGSQAWAEWEAAHRTAQQEPVYKPTTYGPGGGGEPPVAPAAAAHDKNGPVPDVKDSEPQYWDKHGPVKNQ